MKGVMKVFVVLIALIAISWAQCPADKICTAAEECDFGFKCYIPEGETQGCCYQDLLLNMAVVVLFITFGLIAIVFMIGKVIDNTRIITWSKSELYQVIGTAVILSFYLSSLYLLDNSVGPAFYGSSIVYPGDPPRAALGAATQWTTLQNHVTCYLEQDISGGIKEFLSRLSKLSIFAGFITSMGMSLSIQSAHLMYFWSPFAILGNVNQVLSMVFMAIIASVVQLQIQIEIIRLGTAIFSILLPLGILFRAFPLTRPAGGALIALAIGLTIILPIAYLIVEDVSLHYYNTHCSSLKRAGKCGLDRPSAAAAPVWSTTLSIGSNIEDIKETMETGFSTGGDFTCFGFLIAVEATLLPLFAYAMTLMIVRQLAEIFGAHVDFSTLVRLI